MKLKEILKIPCGMDYVFSHLNLQSGYACNILLNSEMSIKSGELSANYEVLERFYEVLEKDENALKIGTLRAKLKTLKNISNTLHRLSVSEVLDDIEFFEIKFMAILSEDVKKLLSYLHLEDVIEFEDMKDVIKILDPDAMRIASFYVYDSYSEKLSDLRKKQRSEKEFDENLFVEISEEEHKIRTELAEKLLKYVKKLSVNQEMIAKTDIFLSKAEMMKNWNFCIPEISTDTETSYKSMFNPEVKDSVETLGRKYQAVDISFGKRPTLITGANTGGKTVVLKTVTLNQFLFQFGFGAASASAKIDIKDNVYFCIGDYQSVKEGLSSFASEIVNIDKLIKASRELKHSLILFDEPARSTNPAEGNALVSALLQIMISGNADVLLATHYAISKIENVKYLKVKGLEKMQMNYALEEVSKGFVPREAINIAENLGADSEWLEMAKNILEEYSKN